MLPGKCWWPFYALDTTILFLYVIQMGYVSWQMLMTILCSKYNHFFLYGIQMGNVSWQMLMTLLFSRFNHFFLCGIQMGNDSWQMLMTDLCSRFNHFFFSKKFRCAMFPGQCRWPLYVLDTTIVFCTEFRWAIFPGKGWWPFDVPDSRNSDEQCFLTDAVDRSMF